MASNVAHSQSRTRTKDMLERQRQVVTPVPPVVSARSPQSRDTPDVADAPYTEATGASVNVSLHFIGIHCLPT